jgi:hypothetical protein
MSSTTTANTLYEVMKEFNMEAFITFLNGKNLGLNKNEIPIFCDQGIDGYIHPTQNSSVHKK